MIGVVTNIWDRVGNHDLVGQKGKIRIASSHSVSILCKTRGIRQNGGKTYTLKDSQD